MPQEQMDTKSRLTVETSEDLRDVGQIAVRLMGYDSMKDFIEEKLMDVIQKAGLTERLSKQTIKK